MSAQDGQLDASAPADHLTTANAGDYTAGMRNRRISKMLQRSDSHNHDAVVYEAELKLPDVAPFAYFHAGKARIVTIIPIVLQTMWILVYSLQTFVVVLAAGIRSGTLPRRIVRNSSWLLACAIDLWDFAVAQGRTGDMLAATPAVVWVMLAAGIFLAVTGDRILLRSGAANTMFGPTHATARSAFAVTKASSASGTKWARLFVFFPVSLVYLPAMLTFSAYWSCATRLAEDGYLPYACDDPEFAPFAAISAVGVGVIAAAWTVNHRASMQYATTFEDAATQQAWMEYQAIRHVTYHGNQQSGCRPDSNLLASLGMSRAAVDFRRACFVLAAVQVLVVTLGPHFPLATAITMLLITSATLVGLFVVNPYASWQLRWAHCVLQSANVFSAAVLVFSASYKERIGTSPEDEAMAEPFAAVSAACFAVGTLFLLLSILSSRTDAKRWIAQVTKSKKMLSISNAVDASSADRLWWCQELAGHGLFVQTMLRADAALSLARLGPVQLINTRLLQTYLYALHHMAEKHETTRGAGLPRLAKFLCHELAEQIEMHEKHTLLFSTATTLSSLSVAEQELRGSWKKLVNKMTDRERRLFPASSKMRRVLLKALAVQAFLSTTSHRQTPKLEN